MTGLVQLSVNLRDNNEQAIRVFGDFSEGATMFPGSTICNMQWSDHKRKNFNVCLLADGDTTEAKKERKLRQMFFFDRWM
jgi:hypothetical protein